MSKAGYYAWRERKPSDSKKSDQVLLKKVRRAHKQSRSSYGQPRVREDLVAVGIHASGKRIARLMRAAGLKGKKRNWSMVSRFAAGQLPAAPNILDRKFNVERPNTAWVTDITSFPTKEGWLHLAVVIDCYSRRVVGWAIGKNIDAALALTALKMGLLKRPYGNLILHSDRGSQFAARDYSGFLQFCGITASMSRKGNCWDNAVAESFFASLKVEANPDVAWATRAEAGEAIGDYIQWYNSKRRHSSNGYLSPVDFERRNVT